jgi:hypothetical protein
MTAYAAQSDVYKYGLPRGALGNPGRLVDSALAATSVVTLCEHSFATGDAVTFRVTQGGTMAAPLVAGTTYYVLYLTDSTFQVSATPNGSAITLTSDAVSMLVSADLPFDDVLEFYSRFVDGFLPAHVIPLPTPYPITIVAIVAELTAKKIQILSGMKSGSMDESEIAAGAQLKRYAAGLPVRDAATTTQPANLSVVRADRRENVIGWGRLWGQYGGGSDPSDNG